jgi:hypothetical protein
MFFSHLEHFTAIWYILFKLKIIWYVPISPFWYIVSKKSGNPARELISF